MKHINLIIHFTMRSFVGNMMVTVIQKHALCVNTRYFNKEWLL